MHTPPKTIKDYRTETTAIRRELKALKDSYHSEIDHLCDFVDLTTEMEWWMAYGLLQYMNPTLMGPSFNLPVDILNSHEVRVKS